MRSSCTAISRRASTSSAARCSRSCPIRSTTVATVAQSLPKADLDLSGGPARRRRNRRPGAERRRAPARRSSAATASISAPPGRTSGAPTKSISPPMPISAPTIPTPRSRTFAPPMPKPIPATSRMPSLRSATTPPACSWPPSTRRAPPIRRPCATRSPKRKISPASPARSALPEGSRIPVKSVTIMAIDGGKPHFEERFCRRRFPHPDPAAAKPAPENCRMSSGAIALWTVRLRPQTVHDLVEQSFGAPRRRVPTVPACRARRSSPRSITA